MGWWSCEVLGGDQPLDELANIGDAMGVEFNYEKESGLGSYLNSYFFTKKIVEKHLDALVAKANVSEWDGQISLQVLGVVAMAVGATIAESKLEKILEAVEMDVWAKEQDDCEGEDGTDRREKMNEFTKQLKAYNGESVAVKSKGLLETIYEGISK